MKKQYRINHYYNKPIIKEVVEPGQEDIDNYFKKENRITVRDKFIIFKNLNEDIDEILDSEVYATKEQDDYLYEFKGTVFYINMSRNESFFKKILRGQTLKKFASDNNLKVMKVTSDGNPYIDFKSIHFKPPVNEVVEPGQESTKEIENMNDLSVGDTVVVTDTKKFKERYNVKIKTKDKLLNKFGRKKEYEIYGKILEKTTDFFLIEFDVDIGGHGGTYSNNVSGKAGHCWNLYPYELKEQGIEKLI